MEPLIHLEGMEYPEPQEEKCNWCLVVMLAVSALVVVLAAVHVWQYASVAALLPGIVDHQPRERRLFRTPRTMWQWFDDNKDAWARYAILAFVGLFAWGVLK